MLDKKLVVTFSGGETSAMMTYHLLKKYKTMGYSEIVVIFANTGQENEETLIFVNNCQKILKFPVIWLEADVVHEFRKGTKHKIVNFETASRNGEPFEEVCKKYAIPCHTSSHCTRELKLHPIKSYLREIGWKKGMYDTAVGIRLDEMHRVSIKAMDEGAIYPLVDWKDTKNTVRAFWEKMPFRLNLHEHQGNCKWCWKKSMRKLLTIATENPEYFDFPRKMEQNYAKPHKQFFFRGYKSSDDIIELSKQPFEKFTDNYRVTIANFDPILDAAGSCSESCDIYSQ
jgi:hypothetical protein